MGKYIDEQGNQYERLYVVCDAGRNKPDGGVLWLCRCDCGNYTTVCGHGLRNGTTKSCGCLHKDIVSELMKNRVVSKEARKKVSEAQKGEKNSNYKHGLHGTKEYGNIAVQKRNAKKLNQTPELTDNEKNKIIFYYQVSQQLGVGWHVDHIIPLSKGGLHHPDNLQVVTKEYNLAKHNKLNFRKPKTLEYWRI